MESLSKIEENVPVGEFFTFKIGGKARYFSRAASASQVQQLVELAGSLNAPIHVLGGGSNTICANSEINRFMIKMEENFIRPVEETKTNLIIEVGAGTPWDSFVEYAVQKNVSGVEALSAIPGTVGAAPIQNIGAYGQEVKETIISVRAYDIETKSFIEIANEKCVFGYRESVFKGKSRGRFIITSVLFRLSKFEPKTPSYPGVEKYFTELNIRKPSLMDIRNAIISIRAGKLPDPAKIPNAGSFFKNPIISQDEFKRLLNEFPIMPSFATLDNARKIPAGWLIEQCGFKGVWRGNVGVYEKNALILIGNGKATYEDLMNLKNEIVSVVRKKFGISLEMEPDVLD